MSSLTYVCLVLFVVISKDDEDSLLFCTEIASFSLVIFEKDYYYWIGTQKKLGEWREKYRDRKSIETGGWSIWFK